MEPAQDERLAWLNDKDLYLFVAARARKLRQHRDDAQDIAQDAYYRATRVFAQGGGPRDRKAMRRWMCAVLKNALFAWAKKKGVEPQVTNDDFPEVVAEDEREIAEQLMSHEAKWDQIETVLAFYPKHVDEVRRAIDPERKEALTDRERQALKRARTLLSGALVAAGVALLVLGLKIHSITGEQLSPNLQAAATLRDRAKRHCGSEEWAECLVELADAKELDPAGDANVEGERRLAVQRIGREERKNAIADCQSMRWQKCIEGLDRAKQNDPEGDNAVEVRNLREEAVAALEVDAGTVDTKEPPKDGGKGKGR